MMVLILLLSEKTSAQSWGIGIRLGDPSGITLKRYMGGNALELSIGRTHLFNGPGYYNNQFNSWYNGKVFGYKEFQYLSYRSSTPIGMQVHYLFHKDLGNADGLSWYFGLGGQFRFQSYNYDYRYKLEGSPIWYNATGEKVTNLDIGADGVIGLEYTFENAPISIFGDFNLMIEFFDNPFLFWPQGGLGARYNF